MKTRQTLKTEHLNLKSLSSYLTVTAGVGCAASVADAAIQVVDLSGLTPTPGTMIPFPSSTGDSAADLFSTTAGNSGYLQGIGAVFYSNSTAYSYSDNTYTPAVFGYTSGPAAFPTTPLYEAQWNIEGADTGRFSVGVNWVAFRDSAQNFGWFSFTLSTLDINSTSPISSFGSFVYDDTSTSPATAIPLETAIAAAAAVPEPSGLTLLALGSAGLAARRRRITNFVSSATPIS